MDIQKSTIFQDIIKLNYGHLKLELWISKKSAIFKYILKYIIIYPKIMFNIGYQKMYFVISINRLIDVLNSI